MLLGFQKILKLAVLMQMLSFSPKSTVRLYKFTVCLTAEVRICHGGPRIVTHCQRLLSPPLSMFCGSEGCITL